MLKVRRCVMWKYVSIGGFTSIVSTFFLSLSAWGIDRFEYVLKLMKSELKYSLPGGIIVGLIVGIIAAIFEKKPKNDQRFSIPIIFLLLVIATTVVLSIAVDVLFEALTVT
jgi:hypothetical protein